MSQHIIVEENYVESLLENAAWDAARVPLSEKKDSGQKKDDKPKGKAKKDDDKPDFTTGARKGDKSDTHPGKDFEDDEDGEKCEAVAEAVCPLCESVLEEDLSDEAVWEHISKVKNALSMNEDEYKDDEESDKQIETEGTSKVAQKVKELKKKTTGN